MLGVKRFSSPLKTQQTAGRQTFEMANKFIVCINMGTSQNVRLKGPSNWSLSNILNYRETQGLGVSRCRWPAGEGEVKGCFAVQTLEC